MEFVIVIVIIFVYFLPSIIASSREHHNSTALFFFFFFFGWTFIGCVVCLIWALTNKSEDTTIINNNTNSEDASVADELEKLLKLKDAGILNEDEFRSQKEKILS